MQREKTSQSFRDALQNKSKARKGDETVLESRPNKVARLEENNSNITTFPIISHKRNKHFEFLKTRELELDRLQKSSPTQRFGSEQTLSTIFSRNETYNDIGNYKTKNIRSNSQDTFQRMLSTNNDGFHHETTENIEAPKINPFLFPILSDATMLSPRNNDSFNWKQDSMQKFNSEFVTDTKPNKMLNVKDAIHNMSLQIEDINRKKEISKSPLEDCVAELIAKGELELTAKGELNWNTSDRKDFFRNQQQKQAAVSEVLANTIDNEEDSRTFDLLFQFTESYTNMNDDFPYEPNQLHKHE